MMIDAMHLEATDYKQALEQMADYALDREYVREGYDRALLEREADFPTGLRMSDDFGLAIPHADPEHVRKAAVLIGLPEASIPFHRMEAPEKWIDAELIVLLIIKDTEGYTPFLSSLVGLFQESSFPEHVRDRNVEKLVDLIQRRCIDEG